MSMRGPRALLVASVLTSCANDPHHHATDAGPRDAGPPPVYDTPACVGVITTPPAVSCTPLVSDYAPGANDAWPACISDDDSYHRIDPTIGALQRVAAFDELRAMLFDPAADPTPADFLAARLVYQQDEGIDSRIVRRYDPHFVAPNGTDCTQPGVPAAYPDYCVGPSKLQPLVLGAFEGGVLGSNEPPRVHAARIEAALIWFFYVSTYKESLTCTGTPKDCDSAYAKYAGAATTREEPTSGLSHYVDTVDPAAHERAWDGLLALRCWRDLDPSSPATDLARRDLARAQYDRAVLDGVAAVLRERLLHLCTTDDAELGYYWASARVLGELVDRAMTAADAVAAATLRAELSRDAVADVDVAAAIAALDAVFTCP